MPEGEKKKKKKGKKTGNAAADEALNVAKEAAAVKIQAQARRHASVREVLALREAHREEQLSTDAVLTCARVAWREKLDAARSPSYISNTFRVKVESRPNLLRGLSSDLDILKTGSPDVYAAAYKPWPTDKEVVRGVVDAFSVVEALRNRVHESLKKGTKSKKVQPSAVATRKAAMAMTPTPQLSPVSDDAGPEMGVAPTPSTAAAMLEQEAAHGIQTADRDYDHGGDGGASESPSVVPAIPIECE